MDLILSMSWTLQGYIRNRGYVLKNKIILMGTTDLNEFRWTTWLYNNVEYP